MGSMSETCGHHLSGNGKGSEIGIDDPTLGVDVTSYSRQEGRSGGPQPV